MPKLTKQAYITKGVGSIDLPSERLIGWAMRRLVQLKIRFRVQTTGWRKGKLKQKLQDYFNSLADSDEDVEGRYFWVTDHRTSHMGPCLFCLEQEEKFRNTGANMEFLFQIMSSEPCLSWHWNSRLGHGVTYSRVLPESEANDFGIGIYGGQSPQGAEGDVEGFILTDKMKNDIRTICTIHVQETIASANRLAHAQLNQEALSRNIGGKDTAGIQNVAIA